ncbi:SDR family oxidoreductase [Sphingomonas mesophila]|uniref:SDR family oxidoreductase n=1 Tax=Sphingomonas mesophila TaxID=2303576 RepID=UPI000E57DCCD|nr:SDR family oxidoreductase [Sphingomonas mesophila]
MTATHLLPADLAERLAAERRRWLVTGAAGFIGSNLVEALLACGQEVVGLDNYATGHRRNIAAATAGAADRFTMIEADICDRAACRAAVTGCEVVLHQAALGSVPRSLEDPLSSHDANVTGFINMLDSARTAAVGRFVYAASSSTYGDLEELPKVEERTGRPLSPYAATKLIDEIYAEVYQRSYGFTATGLRYFNVFGPRQDPEGAYAAVIPKWVAAMIADVPVTINGDGETSRDFCFVANAVQANVLAALAPDAAQGEVFNVAFGGRTSLNQLFGLIRDGLARHQLHYDREPARGDFRAGDVRHSQADIGKARAMLGYRPSHDVERGLAEALPYYIENAGR